MDKSSFLSQKKKKNVFSMKDVISLLPRNLTQVELVSLHQELSDEINERASKIGGMILPGIINSFLIAIITLNLCRILFTSILIDFIILTSLIYWKCFIFSWLFFYLFFKFFNFFKMMSGRESFI